ncbi:MAG: 5'/3'-nucleotidase SurE [Spirochaetales bacterium]|jgi:5'-nucleotidase|nr:5'/3'-nucleotidase SurE [Spirochaetales bacterium]
MKILLTNDDGIDSPAIAALSGALQGQEVWICAPDRERSAASSSITLQSPVRFEERSPRVYACSGTPADCVLYALCGALPLKPDLVISGINRGSNMGGDIIYSGTAAAARQGALMGYPSLAVSQCAYTAPFYFERSAAFVAQNLEALIRFWEPGYYLNINVPNTPEGPLEARLTIPGQTFHTQTLHTLEVPNGDKYHYFHIQRAPLGEAGTDARTVSEGFISVSRVFIYLNASSQAPGETLKGLT